MICIASKMLTIFELHSNFDECMNNTKLSIIDMFNVDYQLQQLKQTGYYTYSDKIVVDLDNYRSKSSAFYANLMKNIRIFTIQNILV